MIEIPFTTIVKPILVTLLIWMLLFVAAALVGPRDITAKEMKWVIGVTISLALLYPLTHFGVLVWK